MRKIALALAAILCIQAFCPALQQTFATASAISDRGAVGVDINDSEAYFQTALRQKPARDNTRRIESLLSRMTLEEKVGQMTQLEIGMVTTGSNQEIQIDP